MSLYEDQEVETGTIESPEDFQNWLEEQDIDNLNDSLAVNILASDATDWKNRKQLKALATVYVNYKAESGEVAQGLEEDLLNDIVKRVETKRKVALIAHELEETKEGYLLRGNKDGKPTIRRLTDFYVKNVRMTKQGREYLRIVDVQKGSEVIESIPLDGDHMTSIISFRRHMEKRTTSTVRQDVTPIEFQAIIDRIKSLPVSYVVIKEYLGCHYDQDMNPAFAYVNMDDRGMKYIDYMRVPGVDSVPYYFSENFELDLIFRFPPTKQEEWHSISKTIFDNIPFVNSSTRIYIILAWFLTTPLKHMQDNDRGGEVIKSKFPILSVKGTPGSGKSAVISLMSKMMGHKAGTGASFERVFSAMKHFSYSNSFFHWIDEYKVDTRVSKEAASTLAGMMRRAFDSGIEERGTADQKKITYNLKAPIVISGESAFSDQALLERTIQITFSKEETDKNYKDKKEFMLLDNLGSAELNQFATGYYNWLLENFSEWAIWAKNAEKEAMELNVDIDGRMKRSITWIILGMNIINMLAEKIGFKSIHQNERDEVIAYLAENGKSVKTSSALDSVFMQFLSDNWHTGLVPGGNYNYVTVREDKDGTIIFHSEAWKSKFREYCAKGDRGPQTNDIISRLISDIALTEAITGVSDNIRISGKLYRTFRVNINKTEERYGIPAEIWDYDPNEIG